MTLPFLYDFTIPYIAVSISSGLNPATPKGMLYFSASGSYILLPVITETCPGAKNPSTEAPCSINPSITSGIVLMAVRSLMFFIFSFTILSIKSAYTGAVVSNPTAANI